MSYLLPEGMITLTAFAAAIGVHQNVVYSWAKVDMIPVRRKPNGASLGVFYKDAVKSPAVTKYLLSQGLPLPPSSMPIFTPMEIPAALPRPESFEHLYRSPRDPFLLH